MMAERAKEGKVEGFLRDANGRAGGGGGKEDAGWGGVGRRHVSHLSGSSFNSSALTQREWDDRIESFNDSGEDLISCCT